MPAGSELSYIVLDADLLQLPGLSLVDKLVLAYYEQSVECSPEALTPDFCAHFLGVTPAEVRESRNKIRREKDEIPFEVGGDF